MLIGALLVTLAPDAAYASDQPSDAVVSTDSVLERAEGAELVVPAALPEKEEPALSHSVQPQANVIPLTEVPSINENIDSLASPAGVPAPDPVRLVRDDVPAEADVIVSGFELRHKKLIALEMINRTDTLIRLAQWRIAAIYVVDGNEIACQVDLSGYIQPRASTTLVQEGADVRVDRAPDAPLYAVNWDCTDGDGELVLIEVTTTVERGQLVERVLVENARQSTSGKIPEGRWIRKSTGSYRTGKIADFVVPGVMNEKRALKYSELYVPPTSAPLQVLEVYVTPPECAPSDVAVRCARYVKVRNLSAEAIDLQAYRLRGGAVASRSTTANTTPLQGTIAPGDVKLIVAAPGRTLYLGAETGTVWFEDQFGVMSFAADSAVTPYVGANTVAKTGLSWAYDEQDGVWKWSLPSPDTAENIIQVPGTTPRPAATSSLTPCRTDQYRHPETNRCRLLAAASTTTLTPCKEGQYRSEETNRCRSIASAVRQLVPCRDDQYRSELTNRCRLVATASSQLKPCKDNQYRSEETNRCRTIVTTSPPAAAFAVEPVADSRTTFAGWWILAGLGVVAVGYAGWEWRREVMSGLRRVTRHLRRTPSSRR